MRALIYRCVRLAALKSWESPFVNFRDRASTRSLCSCQSVDAKRPRPKAVIQLSSETAMCHCVWEWGWGGGLLKARFERSELQVVHFAFWLHLQQGSKGTQSHE